MSSRLLIGFPSGHRKDREAESEQKPDALDEPARKNRWPAEREPVTVDLRKQGADHRRQRTHGARRHAMSVEEPPEFLVLGVVHDLEGLEVVRNPAVEARQADGATAATTSARSVLARALAGLRRLERPRRFDELFEHVLRDDPVTVRRHVAAGLSHPIGR